MRDEKEKNKFQNTTLFIQSGVCQNIFFFLPHLNIYNNQKENLLRPK